jgi:starch phosphorylase
LPRHLEIIYEINARFLDEVRLRYPFDGDRIERLSIIEEAGPRYVRMAHLACVGSFAVNGVAELHSRLLKETVLHDFYELWPHKFQNKTNGVTPRRFMMLSNPGLTALLKEAIGSEWENDLSKLRRLESHADDPLFQERWRENKRACKLRLAATIAERCGVKVNPDSLYDVQAKRIHEYKRQHLNVLHIITLYNRIKRNPALGMTPRTFIFGGKSAPGYNMAKLIIRLINAVGDVVNRDPEVAGRLKVVFLPNFSVKMGHGLYPAADLSEQISTAGKEASGTGNMKFSMNGALTIGTLDGANVEIREEVGEDNFFLFGQTAEQVARTLADGYRPWDIYNGNLELKAVIDLIGSGVFSHGDRRVFQPLLDNLLSQDPYLLFADYAAYVACQDQVSAAYRDTERWTRMSILNVARMGKFSSDRTIAEYCRDIWRVTPTPVAL